MTTLTQSKNATLSRASSFQSTGILAKQNPFDSSPAARFGQRSGQSQSSSGTRASWGFALRSSSPQVTGISGNGTSSTTGVQQMHNGGTWEFFRNGAFRFTPNGLGIVARTDLFPLTGNYRISGSTLSFSGSRSSSTSVSRNFASLNGAISLRNGAATVNQRTVTTTVANINSTPFGQTIDRTVRLNMRMVQIA